MERGAIPRAGSRGTSRGSRDGYRGGSRGGSRGGGSRGGGSRGGGSRGGGSRGGGHANNKRDVKFGYKALEALLSNEPDNLVIDMTSERCFPATEELLESLELRDDLLVLVVKVFGRACDCTTARGSLLKLLNLLPTSRFFVVHLSEYLNTLPVENMHRLSEGETVVLLRTIVKLFSEVLQRLPSSFAKLPIAQLQMCASTLVASGCLRGDRGIEAAVEELMKLRNAKIEEVKKSAPQSQGRFRRGYNDASRLDDEAPPDDFRQMSVIPTHEDVQTTETPFLRRNKVDGRYHDAEHYLDVQFRLLREDFVRPLREGIHDLLEKLGSSKLGALQDIRIYHKVRILYPVFTSKGLTFKIGFDVSRFKKINWQNSKRLIYGSLLCLSKDNFETFILATVENRKMEELKEGKVDVFFHNRAAANQINIGNDVYKMVETTAYFEAYRHVLKGLQEVEPDTVPFQRYIIQCEKEVAAPAYLTNRFREKVTYDLSPIMKGYKEPTEGRAGARVTSFARLRLQMSGLQLEDNALLEKGKSVNLLDQASWPSAESLEVDGSQLRAVQMALTKEFAVIQGPPGTGKTYIGLKVAKVLLHNKDKWDCGTELVNDDDDDELNGIQERLRIARMQRLARPVNRMEHRPLLVICYTNHALDQFLEGIHNFHPDGIIRVGGRSQSEIMQKCSLSEHKHMLHKEKKAPQAIRRAFFEIHTTLDDITNKMKQATDNLKKCMESVVSESEVHRAGRARAGLMTQAQHRSLCQRLVEMPKGFAMPYWLGLIANVFETSTAANVHPIASFPFTAVSGRQNLALQVPHEAHIMGSSHAPGVDGLPAGSVRLHGNPRSYIQIPNVDGFLLDTTLSITIALYVYPEGNEGGPIVCYYGYGNRGVQVCQNGMQGDKGVLSVTFVRRDLAPNRPLSKAVLNMNKWNYIAASYNNFTGMAQLWHDGKIAQEAYIGEGQLLATQFNVLMGSLGGQRQAAHFTGRVAGLNIFPEAIGREQIWNIAGITEEDIQDEEEMENEEDKQADGFQYEADVLQEMRVLDVDEVKVYGERGRHRRNDDHDPLAFLDLAIGGQGGGWQFQNKKRLREKIRRSVKKEMISTDMMTGDEAGRVKDVWALEPRERWRLYRWWVHNLCDEYRNTIALNQGQFERGTERLNEIKNLEDLSILKNATVIGMTTTGAAKFRSLIQEIKPRITIVEEAAEVLESHIVTSLSPGCQHLILIGDHQQLRPNPTVFRLAKDYHLDVSLFERMVTNGMPFERLRKQHRMRPEIASMLTGIYDDLENHESVLTFENIKGVNANMYFIDHQELEEFIDEGRSRSNLHEAKYLAALCRYFILQGYKRTQITVLTMYTGQLLQLKKEMPKNFFEGVRVCAVDNFQGEENDIILLSLVRSNEEGKIGFLKTSNRVCVALSRAKKGFYCIGNMGLMAEKEQLWRDIIKDARDQGKVGEYLTLTCQNHPKNTIHASRAEDFRGAPEGGCMEPCNTRLACGHVCRMVCHPTDPEHEEYQCKEKCALVLCENGHKCTRFCYQDCGPCTVPVPKIIPKCRHSQQVPCYVEPSEFPCRVPCAKTLECGHQCNETCGSEHCTQKCLVLTEKTWPCGHKLKVECYVDPTLTPCRAPCNTTLKCEHTCKGNCCKCLSGRVHERCSSNCGRTLFCGHACPEPCTKNCPPCKKVCENRCKHSKCKRECGKPCAKCAMSCVWQCPHFKCTKLCGEPCDRERCNIPCKEKLKCGHDCIGLCGEKCPKKCRVCDKDEVTAILFGKEDEPEARFVELEGCGHIVEASALDRWMDGDEDTKEGSGKADVQLKRCPCCKTEIRTNLRYGNIIKTILRDFEKIKEKMILSEMKKQEVVARIRETLLGLGHRSECYTEGITIMGYLEQKGLTSEQLNVFENQANFLKMLDKLLKNIDAIHGYRTRAVPSTSSLSSTLSGRKRQGIIREELQNGVLSLKKRIMTARPRFSDQELEELNEEVHRMALLVSVKAIEVQLRSQELKPLSARGQSWMDIINHAVDSGKVIEPTSRERYMKILDRIRKKYLPDVRYQPITADEKQTIVKAMGLSQGHWFKCPKGHIYCIGDCGGAMMESKCPECGSGIGGSSHRLRSDNTLATEMDGARRPAWGEMANLENFDLGGLNMD